MELEASVHYAGHLPEGIFPEERIMIALDFRGQDIEEAWVVARHCFCELEQRVNKLGLSITWHHDWTVSRILKYDVFMDEIQTKSRILSLNGEDGPDHRSEYSNIYYLKAEYEHLANDVLRTLEDIVDEALAYDTWREVTPGSEQYLDFRRRLRLATSLAATLES